mmetsp:Transcript_142912/g.252316  ORF Transcript_142912/g.252316 Transcript_142912/m.252316 type:complete len:221 (-) Transcript_142912:39-701(-)
MAEDERESKRRRIEAPVEAIERNDSVNAPQVANREFVKGHKEVLAKVTGAIRACYVLVILKGCTDFFLEGVFTSVMDDVAYAAILLHAKQRMGRLQANQAKGTVEEILLEALDATSTFLACYCPWVTCQMIFKLAESAAKRYGYESVNKVLWSALVYIGVDSGIEAIETFFESSLTGQVISTLLPVLLIIQTLRGRIPFWVRGSRVIADLVHRLSKQKAE